MEKFKFLLGDWNLEYHVPKSAFSEAMTGSGHGSFKRALADKIVFFDYEASLPTGKGSAHGIFTRDEKAKLYRYWWFESSGSFMTATCNFINEKTLFLSWHDSLLIQTFKKAEDGKVVLRMENPNARGVHELILEVIFTRA